VRIPLPNIPERLQRPFRYGGYVLFALLAYVTVLYATFPYDRIKDRIEAEVSASEDVDVTIGRLGPSPLFGLAAHDVVIRKREDASRPAPLGGAPLTGGPASAPAETAGANQAKTDGGIRLDKVTVHVSPFSLLLGRRSFSFAGRAFGGKFSGSFSESKEERALDLSVSAIQLVSLPWVKELIDVPVAGALSGSLEITLPKKRMSQASGSI